MIDTHGYKYTIFQSPGSKGWHIDIYLNGRWVNQYPYSGAYKTKAQAERVVKALMKGGAKG